MFDIEQLIFDKKILCINSVNWHSEVDKEKITYILQFRKDSKSLCIKETKPTNFTDVGFLFPTIKTFTHILGNQSILKVLNITNNLMINFVEDNESEILPPEVFEEFAE